MAGKFFGQFLLEKHSISRSDLLRALELQGKYNLRFGDIVLARGMMTEEQVSAVHQAQRYNDLRFGEMAVNKGFLSAEQVTLVLNEQRENYLYLGEALVNLGSLSREELDVLLEKFNQQHKPQLPHEIILPVEIPHQQILEIIVDMSCKMLTRVAGLTFRLGPANWVDQCPDRSITVEAGFSGGIKARLLMTLSGKIRNLLANKVLNTVGQESYPRKILDEALVQFVNLVCGNAAGKANQSGHELETIPARLHNDKKISRNENEFGIIFPVYLPEGDVIETAIFAER